MARNVIDNIRKYFWITLFKNSSLLAPVLTFFYLSRGLDYSKIFILYTVIVISMFIFEVPTGIFGDKFGRSKSIQLGLFGWIIFGIGLLFANSFWTFFMLYILFGINMTLSSGSDEALIYDSLKQTKKEKKMKKYMSKIVSAKFIPLIIIAPIGAIISKDLTYLQFNILLIGNIVFAISAFCISLALVEPKINTGPHEVRSPIKLFFSSLSDIKNSPTLVKLFLNKTLILIPGMHIFALLWQPYLKESGIPVAGFGFLIAICAVFIWFFARKIDKIETIISDRKLLFLTGILPLISFILAAFFRNIFVAIMFYFIIRIMVWAREPIFSHYINQHIRSKNRATVLSSLSMIDSLFDIIIFLTAGFIADISISYTFIFSAGVILIALISFRIREKHIN
ncbi:MAG: MFS transporter [Nanoarchaeota archaeon]|nr:MFS transporter [Nanoarchaeota archaeon]